MGLSATPQTGQFLLNFHNFPLMFLQAVLDRQVPDGQMNSASALQDKAKPAAASFTYSWSSLKRSLGQSLPGPDQVTCVSYWPSQSHLLCLPVSHHMSLLHRTRVKSMSLHVTGPDIVRYVRLFLMPPYWDAVSPFRDPRHI